MIRRFSAGLIAAAAFAFIAPLGATAKGYQSSMVDSTAIEGQFLIAGAGNKTACEAKGKSWKPTEESTAETVERWAKKITASGNRAKDASQEYCDGAGQNDDYLCSCQKS